MISSMVDGSVLEKEFSNTNLSLFMNLVLVNYEGFIAPSSNLQ
jgi:hypothetical protein